MRLSSRATQACPRARTQAALRRTRRDSFIVVVVGRGYTITVCDHSCRDESGPDDPRILTSAAGRAHSHGRPVRDRRGMAMGPGGINLPGNPGERYLPVYFVYCENCRKVDQLPNVPSICPRRQDSRPKNVWVRLRCRVCRWEPGGWYEEAPECPKARSEGQPHGEFEILEIDVPYE
jgi:hypothetical protein